MFAVNAPVFLAVQNCAGQDKRRCCVRAVCCVRCISVRRLGRLFVCRAVQHAALHVTRCDAAAHAARRPGARRSRCTSRARRASAATPADRPLRCYRMTSRRANPALGAPATAAWTPRRHTVGRVVRCKSHDRELRILLPGRMRAGVRRAASQALPPGSTSAVPRPSRTCSGIAARTCADRAQTPLERRTHANGEITTAIIAATHDGWGAAIGAPTHLVGVAGGGVGGVVAVPVQRQREVQRAAVEQVRRPGTSTPSTLQHPLVPSSTLAPSSTQVRRPGTT